MLATVGDGGAEASDPSSVLVFNEAHNIDDICIEALTVLPARAPPRAEASDRCDPRFSEHSYEDEQGIHRV